MASHKSRPVVILSSLVAGSRVGGGVTSDILSRAGFWPQLVPTIILGRHPGLGAPGGGAVPDAVFAGALDGLEAMKASPEAILTGYFTTPDQVNRAAEFIRNMQSQNPDCVVLVDPILGDGLPDGSDEGLYIPRPVAEAIRDELLPLASLTTPNVYEFSWLSGRPILEEYAALETLATWPGDSVVTSVPDGTQGLLTIGKTGTHIAQHRAQQRPDIDHGSGDLFAAVLLRNILQGKDRPTAIALAHDEVQDHLPVKPVSSPEPASGPASGKTPAWVAGLDGCPSGWVCVMVDLNGLEPPRRQIFSTLQDALDAPEHFHVIAVDMPIGFSDTPDGPGGRACEREARSLLGPRSSSVFASPLRPALAEPDYQSAMAANRAAGGPGLSKQSYMLFRKMREIDAVMTPALEGCVHEVHPEVSFTVISGAPMQHNKKTPAGRQQRLGILTEQGLPLDLFDPHPWKKKDAAPDDLVDAGVCALTAVRLARGLAMCLPADPPRDSTGLRMAIWA